VHVRGKLQSNSLSFYNRLEAETLSNWLTANLRYTFNRSIAILTPYPGQKEYLNQLLKVLNITVPVYLLSEATNLEQDIILFSPVYTSHCKKPYLLDQGEYLINVALNCAKESFMIFADMGIFDSFRQSPSGKLAQLLFKSGKNRVLHVPLQERSNEEIQVNEVKIVGVSSHFENILAAIDSVQHELCIISCQVNLKTLQDLNLLEKVKLLTQKSITCKLYLSNIKIDGTSWRTPEVLEYLNQLVALGASVIIIQGLHTNAYWCDGQYFVEGTQPWLAFDSSNAQSKDESISLIYPKETAMPLIQELQAQLMKQTVKSLVSSIEESVTS